MPEAMSYAIGHKFDPSDYDSLMPHQKKFYDTVKQILDLGITPTPKVVNEALGKPIRTSWNAPLCRIRQYLLQQYGYEPVRVGRGIGGGVIRYKKKQTGV